jgi:hypothetical protein
VLVIFAIVLGTARSTEWLLRIHDEGRVGASTYEGAPFSYRVLHPASVEGTRSRVEFDRAAYAANLGLFAVLGLLAAIHWSHAARSSGPSKPVRLPLGAEPLPPQASAHDHPRLRRMAIRSAACLTMTMAGAFLGLGVIVGLLGGWYGSRLCLQYEMLGRQPAWMATTAREIGPAIALTSLLAAMGVLLHWGPS